MALMAMTERYRRQRLGRDPPARLMFASVDCKRILIGGYTLERTLATISRLL